MAPGSPDHKAESMNDIRRTILWVVFAFSSVLLWDKWQIHNGGQAMFFPTPARQGASAAVPSGGVQSELPKAGNAQIGASVPTSSASLPSATHGAATASAALVILSTDVLKLSIDPVGATIMRAEFDRHVDLNDKTRKFTLFDRSPERRYFAQSGLVGGDFPNHGSVMAFSGDSTLKSGTDELTARFESQELGGVRLVKTLTLKRGSYEIAVKHEIINRGLQVVSPQLYVQLVRDSTPPPGESSFYSTFTGPAVYTEAKKFQKVEFSEIEKNKASFETKASDGYVAIVQHYFASAWLLPANMARENFMRKIENGLFAAGSIATLDSIAPGASRTVLTRLFVGPQEEKVLEAVAPGLELVKDYGWLTILAKPLYWLLDQLYGYLLNWGWAIVALVILLKGAFYWLNAQAYRSMAKMKAINPKIMEMRERLKDKPQQMQQEMMRIYREEKVNPMGGCFPILVQIPVFIALYWVLLSSVEMRNAPWALWINDLSAPDPWFVLPVVMTATTMFQTWLNPKPPDPMQAKLMWYMPLAFSVMFFFFPSGLVLYWITNNILSIAQQWLINKRMGVNGK
jgi:YidC/Oxa1 family membrane protein insertase